TYFFFFFFKKKRLLIEFTQFRNFLLIAQTKGSQSTAPKQNVQTPTGILNIAAMFEDPLKGGDLSATNSRDNSTTIVKEQKVVEMSGDGKLGIRQLLSRNMERLVTVTVPTTTDSEDKIKSLQFSSECSAFHVDLPSDIVQSEIVYDDTLTPNTKFKLLVEKYIFTHSKFALNVSSQTRFALTRLYNEVIAQHGHARLQTDIDYGVFDVCSWELYALMHDNFARFKLSDAYIKYCKSVQ
ncbi:hypothetical protein RFI_02120, partial [Reticulomyxa filosa]